MKKALLISLVLLIMASIFLSGCGEKTTTTTKPATTTPTTSTPTGPSGTINVAIADFSAEATDPTLYESIWGWAMYDSLITTSNDGRYIPEVAESWDVSADGLTWTFHIREDIYFWNGEQLTAEDVNFTLTRFTSEESTNPWSSGLRANLDSMRVVDKFTYEFKTVKPELPLTSSFAATRIIAKNYYESVGQDAFRKSPMGSGPWIFVEHIPETSFKMKANTNYWDAKNVPEFEYVIEYQVPEEATQIAMFKRGEIDMPMGITAASRAELIDLGYRTQKIGLSAPVVLNFQGTWFEKAGATHDIRIREALSLAINRQELCDTIYEGNAVPGGLFALQPGGFGVTDDLIAPDPYDVAKAKQLMADAGYPDAFDNPVITLFTTSAPAGMELMQAVQAYWMEVGFQVKVEILEATVWMAYFFNTLGMTEEDPNVGWAWAWTGGSADSTYMQKNLLTTAGVHQMLRDPAVDQLYQDYLTNTDPDKAFDLFNKFLKAGYSQRICIGLVLSEPLFAISHKLGEFTTNTHMYYSDTYSGIKHPR